MVIISGQVPTAAIGLDAFQEVDTVGITRPCVKHNFLVKNVNDPAIRSFFQFYEQQNDRLREENRILKTRITTPGGIGGLLGDSAAMHRVFEMIRKVARTNASVLNSTGGIKDLNGNQFGIDFGVSMFPIRGR